MQDLIFYTTSGCHLCEQALALITPLIHEKYRIKMIDISDSEELLDRYGVRIPVVVRADTQRDIGWPFDQQQFLAFLRSA